MLRPLSAADKMLLLLYHENFCRFDSEANTARGYEAAPAPPSELSACLARLRLECLASMKLQRALLARTEALITEIRRRSPAVESAHSIYLARARECRGARERVAG